LLRIANRLEHAPIFAEELPTLCRATNARGANVFAVDAGKDDLAVVDAQLKLAAITHRVIVHRRVRRGLRIALRFFVLNHGELRANDERLPHDNPRDICGLRDGRLHDRRCKQRIGKDERQRGWTKKMHEVGVHRSEVRSEIELLACVSKHHECKGSLGCARSSTR
jgi:hypothetical protein